MHSLFTEGKERRLYLSEGMRYGASVSSRFAMEDILSHDPTFHRAPVVLVGLSTGGHRKTGHKAESVMKSFVAAVIITEPNSLVVLDICISSHDFSPTILGICRHALVHLLPPGMFSWIAPTSEMGDAPVTGC